MTISFAQAQHPGKAAAVEELLTETITPQPNFSGSTYHARDMIIWDIIYWDIIIDKLAIITLHFNIEIDHRQYMGYEH